MMKVRIINFLELVIIMIIPSTSSSLLVQESKLYNYDYSLYIFIINIFSIIYFQNILSIENNDYLSQFDVTDVDL